MSKPVIPNYELTGPEHAPVVVLSNSVGTDRSMWDEQMPALAQRFRVLRYDQRGHGSTPAEPGPYDLASLGGDVLELLDHLQVPSAHFAGVSLGGMIGMWLAEHAPERLEGLALLCTSAQLGTPENWRQRAEFVRANGMAPMVEASLGRWFTPEFSARPDIVEKYGRMPADCDAEGYAGCCEAIASMDIAGDLAKITAPTLVIAGYDDPATPPEHAERISAAVEGSRMEVLRSASHLANVERSDLINPLLVEHFAGGQPSDRSE